MARLDIDDPVVGGRDSAGNDAVISKTKTEFRTLINVEDGSEANNISDADATNLTDGSNADALHAHAAGSGDVTGPGSSTDNAVSRMDGVTGKIIQESLVTIDDAGNTSVPGGATVDGRDVSVDGTKLDGIDVSADANPAEASTPEAQAGTEVALRSWSPVKVKEAIDALAGDVVGPASSVDEAIARYDTTTGKLLQDSLATLSNTGSIGVPALETVDGRDVSVDGTKLDTIETGAQVNTGKVAISANDTTLNFLINKLVAGGGITLVEQNDGANENIIISLTTSDIFGFDYQFEIAGTRSTTTASSYGTKTTLTTPVLTGTYRIGWGAIVDNSLNKSGAVRLQDVTNGVTIGVEQVYEWGSASLRMPMGTFQEVVFSSQLRQLEIQFKDVTGTGTQGIQQAKIEIWRVE